MRRTLDPFFHPRDLGEVLWLPRIPEFGPSLRARGPYNWRSLKCLLGRFPCCKAYEGFHGGDYGWERSVRSGWTPGVTLVM